MGVLWVAGAVVGVVWSSLLQIGPRLCGVRVVWGFEVWCAGVAELPRRAAFPARISPLSKA